MYVYVYTSLIKQHDVRMVDDDVDATQGRLMYLLRIIPPNVPISDIRNDIFIGEMTSNPLADFSLLLAELWSPLISSGALSSGSFSMTTQQVPIQGQTQSQSESEVLTTYKSFSAAVRTAASTIAGSLSLSVPKNLDIEARQLTPAKAAEDASLIEQYDGT